MIKSEPRRLGTEHARSIALMAAAADEWTMANQTEGPISDRKTHRMVKDLCTRGSFIK
jgi:hypothetical protein